MPTCSSHMYMYVQYVCSLCLFSDGLLGYIVIFIELQYS